MLFHTIQTLITSPVPDIASDMCDSNVYFAVNMIENYYVYCGSSCIPSQYYNAMHVLPIVKLYIYIIQQDDSNFLIVLNDINIYC